MDTQADGFLGKIQIVNANESEAGEREREREKERERKKEERKREHLAKFMRYHLKEQSIS